MSDITARLDLPMIQPSQAQKHVTHNEALQVLDGLVQAALEETGATTPPFEPVTGTLYATGANPTDDWAGQPNKLALRITEAWLFIDPQEGWRAWDKATGQFKVFDGSGWAEILPDLNNLDGVGIGTTSDATNRLSVAAAASLFTHDGAGHQLKVNKATPADTASLLFQSGFTGHAEMGLAGDTAFSIKLSDDGTTWHDALRADPATQQLATDFQLTGDAVQQSPTDTTTGRLMRADYGYGPGNLLGTVTQSGGIPTGGAIETGENASGSYVKFANGLMMQWGVAASPSSYVPDGSIYRGGATTFDYPEDFAAGTIPALSVSVNSTDTVWAQARSLVNTGGSARLMAATEPTQSYDVGWLAIGYWFT